MPEPQQIIKINSLFSHCDTYNCRKKVSYAIGRPDGPREIWSYFCEDCMKSIAASIPEELLPEDHYTEMEPETLDEAFNQVIGATDTARGKKTYPCKYCGETFDTPGALGNHVKRCQRKGE